MLVSMGIMSTILLLNPIVCHAEWKQNSIGWWYSNQNSWAIGWQMINNEWYYFDSNGYMQTGWIKTDGKWYYMYEDGSMAKDTKIDGYNIGEDGAWIETNSKSEDNKIEDNKIDNTTEVEISGNGKISNISNIDFNNIEKVIFYDGRAFNQPLTLNNKENIDKFISMLNNIEVENVTNEPSTGWTYKASLYTNNNQRLDITFNDPLIINDKYYKLTKGNITSEEIGDFLKSIESSYITNLK